uniref:protein-tyrosine-phosphatase n=1 Tax=Arion vulgaris TaxID=1028688 RepID=A0A0B7ABK9_9EUPU
MTSQTELEFAEYDSKGKWNEVYQPFQKIKNETSVNEDLTTKRAKEPENRYKNRYKDVNPYDHSRVVLSATNDYINASHIEVQEARRKYILTQGPLEHTMGDFWSMVWEQRTKAIVMLNKVVEKGTLKCSQYWPLGADYGYDQDMYFEEYGLRVTLIKEHDFQHFTLRTLELENMETGDKREVLHFHYTTWPDFGVPSSPNAFLHFLHSVRQAGSLETNVGPAIIHCSAGIGRSGTFCLVDSCLVMVEASGTLDSIDVKRTLTQMRSFRMGLIQTAGQLRFSYLAIIEGARAILSGDGLGSLHIAHPSEDVSQTDGYPPQPPERTTSLRPIKSVFPDDLDISNGEEEEEPPPFLPPKKSPVSVQSAFTGFEGKLQAKSGVEEDNVSEETDEDIEEFNKVHDKEEVDENDGRGDTDEEIRATELRHQIREERKKQTMEKIRLMKEKQLNSERWRQYKPYLQNSIYIGIAVIVGVASIVAYGYMF